MVLNVASVLRTGTLALALGLGFLTAGPVMAQDNATQPVEAEGVGGFDDWGPLGLLGLARLAGPRRGPEVQRAAHPVLISSFIRQ
jgi:hypothetical protein